jgi:hypothetical protein
MEVIWWGVKPGEDDKRDRCVSYRAGVLGNNIYVRPFEWKELKFVVRFKYVFGGSCRNAATDVSPHFQHPAILRKGPDLYSIRLLIPQHEIYSAWLQVSNVTSTQALKHVANFKEIPSLDLIPNSMSGRGCSRAANFSVFTIRVEKATKLNPGKHHSPTARRGLH